MIIVSFLFVLLWWACILGVYYLASHRGRNRLGWTFAAVFAPLLTLLALAVLPRKVSMSTDDYHPDYRRLGT
jgi:hypothetical protein